jgi:hypothetical protein
MRQAVCRDALGWYPVEPNSKSRMECATKVEDKVSTVPHFGERTIGARYWQREAYHGIIPIAKAMLPCQEVAA